MKPSSKMISSNTALLVIDIINSCCDERCEKPEWHIYFSKIREMVPNLEKTVREFKEKIRGLLFIPTAHPGRRKILQRISMNYIRIQK